MRVCVCVCVCYVYFSLPGFSPVHKHSGTYNTGHVEIVSSFSLAPSFSFYFFNSNSPFGAKF